MAIYGQYLTKADSLEHCLQAKDLAKSDKAGLLVQLVLELSDKDPVKAAFFGREACRLTERLHDDSLKARAFKFTGDALYGSGELDSALILSQEAIRLYRVLGDSTGVAGALNLKSNILAEKGKYKEALECSYRALKYYSAAGLKHETAIMYNSISALYINLNDEEKAFQYNQKALELFRKEDYKQGIAACLLNMSGYYFNRNDTVNIFSTTTEALNIFHELGNKANEARALATLGDYYNYIEDDIPLAAENYYKAVALFAETQNSYLAIDAYRNLAIGLYRHGDYEAALDNVNNALAVMDTSNSAYLQMTYYLLTYIYMGLGDFNMGEYAFDRYVELSRQVYNEDLVNSVSEMEVKYETEIKERELLRLSTANKVRTTILYSLLVIILLAAIVVYFIIRQIHQKKTIAEQRAMDLIRTQQLLATQSVLNGEEAERKRMARELHDGLGGLLSGAKMKLKNLEGSFLLGEERAAEFRNTIEILDESVRELRRVAHNMMPEALGRFGLVEALEEFCSSASSKEMLVKFQLFGEQCRPGQTVEIAVYRILQELVNNAMKHSCAELVEVQLICDSERIALSVKDDGKGFDAGSGTASDGMGLRNIRSRVEALNGILDFHSEPGLGTEVMIEINIGKEGPGSS